MNKDSYNLERFKDAQKNSYETALQEIQSGRKRSHWMWYIFPQLKGLGHSSTAQYYGISGMDEAKAYLADPLLGKRLREISEALLTVKHKTAAEIFGYPDVLKLCSCMTLFAEADGEDSVFQKVLETYYQGEKDRVTLDILKRQS